MQERFSVVKQIAIAGTIQLIGLVCAFSINIFIARQLGVVTQGIFQLGLGWIFILSTVGRLGLDQLTLRMVATARSQNDPVTAARKVRDNLKISILSLLLATAAGMIFVSIYERTELGSAAVSILQPMMIAIVPLGLVFILTEALRGWQRYNLGSFLQLAGPWVIFWLLMGLTSLVAVLRSEFLGWQIITAYLLPCLMALIVWNRILPNQIRQPSLTKLASNPLPNRQTVIAVLTEARAFYFNGVAFVLLAWVDVVILSAIATGQDIGIYTAVVRTGSLIGNFVIAANVSLTPQIAVLHARGAFRDMDLTLRKYMYLFVALVPIVLIVFVGFAGPIMSIWGSDYAAGVPLLQLYALFQTQNLVFGIFSFLLLVTHYENQMMRISLFSLGFKAVSVYFGYISYGLWGAIMASGIALALLNGAAFLVYIRRQSANRQNSTTFTEN